MSHKILDEQLVQSKLKTPRVLKITSECELMSDLKYLMFLNQLFVRDYILQSRDKVIEYVEQYKKDKLKADKINKLSRENNIPVFTIRQRMNRGMTLEEASTKPVDKKHLPKNHPNRD